MRILNWIMAVVFLLSLIVQYNDPDPLAWMIVYGMATMVCLLFGLRKLHWRWSAGAGLVALVWSLSLFPPLFASPDPIIWKDVFVDAAMKTRTVEYVREIGGLWIIVGWMGVLTFSSVKSRN